MASSSRKKTRSTSAGDAMKLVAQPEPAASLTYAARESFAFTEDAAAQAAAAAETLEQAAPSATKAVLAEPARAFDHGYGSFAALGSGNVEAVARAGAILAKGLEEMGQSVVSLGQRNLESSLKLARAAIGTTTLRQLVDLQTGYARDSFDRLVAEGNKLQEISLKTANAAMQPLKARMAEAIETLTSRAA